MKFYPRRRRTPPPIIIISLIDVLIVMLVFLLFTTTYKNAPSVKLELPESSADPRAGSSAEAPPMVVTIARGEPTYFVATRAVTSDKLLSELKAARSQDAAVRVVLRADRDAIWGDVFRAMDFAKQAAVTNLKVQTKGRDGSP